MHADQQQFTDVLDDPEYWQPRTEGEFSVRGLAFATMIVAIVGVVILGIAAAVYKATVDNNNHWDKMERTCLQAGGQWIRNDCVNNLIQLHG